MDKFRFSALIVFSSCSLAWGQTRIRPSQINSDPTSEQLRRQDDVKDLVVKLVCTSDSGNVNWLAAGLVVDVESGPKAVVVTSAHSFLLQGQCVVEAEFRWRQGTRFQVRRTEASKEEIDTTILSIQIPEDIAVHLREAGMDTLGSSAGLKANSAVHAIGFPRGRVWAINIAPALVEGVEGDTVYFQGSGVAPGSSGGPLLDTDRRIVGMVSRGDNYFSEAITIERISEFLKQNGRRIGILPRRPPIVAAVPRETNAGLADATAATGPDVVCDGAKLLPRTKRRNEAYVWLLMSSVREAVDRFPRTAMIEALESQGHRVISGYCALSHSGPPQVTEQTFPSCGNTQGIVYYSEGDKGVAETIAAALVRWVKLPVRSCFETNRISKSIVELGGIDILISLPMNN